MDIAAVELRSTGIQVHEPDTGARRSKVDHLFGWSPNAACVQIANRARPGKDFVESSSLHFVQTHFGTSSVFMSAASSESMRLAGMLTVQT